MTKNGFLPTIESEKGLWLKNYAGKIALHASIFGLSAAEVASVAADSAAFNYMLDTAGWFKRETNKLVNYKRELGYGEIGSTLGPLPEVSTMPEQPAAVPAGVFKRVIKMAQRIKSHPAYTHAIGEDLGIESHAIIANTKCEIKVTMDAGQPVIWWKKGNYVAADIFVDRNDGKGFVFLVTATTSRYTDIYELPVGVNVATWQYKAIYKSGNKPTGEYSDIVTVSVYRSIG